jgi:hypothetical protein
MGPTKALELTNAIMKKIKAHPFSKTIDEAVLETLKGEIYSALREAK